MKIIGVTKHPTEDTSVLSKQNVDDTISQGASLVSGTIVMFSHNVIPSGWFLCNGQELSQTTYASLYSVLLSTYNSHPTLGTPVAGNFRVPDFRDLFPLAVNPSGGATTLGTYSTTGWNHTHTIGNHTHGLPTHTHTLSSHTHTVDSLHFHSLDNHSHSIPSHNHSIPYHSHWFPAHYHLHGLTVTVTHRHPIQAKNTGTVGTAAANPRSGNIATNNNTTYNTASGGAYTVSVSGTIGAGAYIDDSIWGGAGIDYLNQEPYTTNAASIRTNTADSTATASGNTENTSTQATFTTGATSADSGAASSNITNSSGSATTGTANPPYIGLNFIIKA